MAALDPGMPRILHSVEGAHKFTVFQLHGVNTGDTLDLSQHFSKIQIVGWINATANQVNVPTVQNSAITFATAGSSNDSGYLVVLGGPA